MKRILFPEQINTENNNPKVVVLGKFESIHLGHRKLLEKGRQIATDEGKELVVMLFSEREVNNFYSMEERLMFISEYKPDYILEFRPIEENFKHTYIEFNNYMLEQGIDTVIIGPDYRYGNNREGNIDTLQDKFNVHVVEELKYNDIPVRTSQIINYIKEGDFEQYKNMMNHYFFYKGEVVRGKGNGKKFDMPTANVRYPEYKIDVPDGIYFSYVIYDGRRLPSLTSISNNPTLNATEKTYETYIYDFDKDIYGEEIYVEIIEKFREPIKFNSIDELIDQLAKDKNYGEKYFNLV